MTLARLELMSALLAARICPYLPRNCDLDFKKVTVWSDSQITLWWIRKGRTTWRTVRNLAKFTSYRVRPFGASAQAKKIQQNY